MRSLSLDKWSEARLSVIKDVGNERANHVWEGNTGPKERPGADCSREEAEQWIRAKYIDRSFLPSPPAALKDSDSSLLFDAAAEGKVTLVLELIAHGADMESSPPSAEVPGQRAIHAAAAKGHAAVVEVRRLNPCSVLCPFLSLLSVPQPSLSIQHVIQPMCPYNPHYPCYPYY